MYLCQASQLLHAVSYHYFSSILRIYSPSHLFLFLLLDKNPEIRYIKEYTKENGIKSTGD